MCVWCQLGQCVLYAKGSLWAGRAFVEMREGMFDKAGLTPSSPQYEHYMKLIYSGTIQIYSSHLSPWDLLASRGPWSSKATETLTKQSMYLTGV